MHARVYSRKVGRCFLERYYSVCLCPVFQTLPCNSTFVFPNVYDDDSHYEDEVRRLSLPDLATSQFLKSFSLLLWILLCVINMNKYPNPRRCVRCVTIEMPRLCEDAKKIHQQQNYLRRAIGECKRIGGLTSGVRSRSTPNGVRTRRFGALRQPGQGIVVIHHQELCAPFSSTSGPIPSYIVSSFILNLQFMSLTFATQLLDFCGSSLASKPTPLLWIVRVFCSGSLGIFSSSTA